MITNIQDWDWEDLCHIGRAKNSWVLNKKVGISSVVVVVFSITVDRIVLTFKICHYFGLVYKDVLYKLAVFLK